jgi:hypothetical protein
MENLIPNLAIDEAMKDNGEFGEVFGIDTNQIPKLSNELANVLASGGFNLRTSAAAISRLLGWLAHQAEQQGYAPEDFMKAVTHQTLNYCRAFSSAASRE